MLTWDKQHLPLRGSWVWHQRDWLRRCLYPYYADLSMDQMVAHGAKHRPPAQFIIVQYRRQQSNDHHRRHIY